MFFGGGTASVSACCHEKTAPSMMTRVKGCILGAISDQLVLAMRSQISPIRATPFVHSCTPV